MKKLNQQSKQKWFQENVAFRGMLEVRSSVDNIRGYARGETPQLVSLFASLTSALGEITYQLIIV
jgi:hypothetical protein